MFAWLYILVNLLASSAPSSSSSSQFAKTDTMLYTVIGLLSMDVPHSLLHLIPLAPRVALIRSGKLVGIA